MNINIKDRYFPG
jgi:hypothetical protein